MLLRNYKEADLPQLIHVLTEAVHGLAESPYTQAQLAAWAPLVVDEAKWRQRIVNRNVLVAVVLDQIVGFISYGTEGHIDMLYVHPDHARQGIATKLLQYVEESLQSDGIERLRTEVSIIARPLFQGNGWGLVDEEPKAVRGRSTRRSKMEKTLQRNGNGPVLPESVDDA